MNNKMKKFNKILMMTVAILLTLVLASTSVVSGIFAKYVVTKSASTEVSLKAFGLTLKVEGTQGTSINYSPSGSNKDTAISVSVSGLQLAPGETLDDVVKFTIDGTPNVDAVKLKIKVKSENVSTFKVAKTNINSVSTVDFAEKIFIPIGFRMYAGTTAATTNTTKSFAQNWKTPTNDAGFATTIASGIASTTFNFTAVDDTNDDTVERIIYNKNNSITTLQVKYLNFGFNCLADGNTGMPSDVDATEADIIQTYLSQNNANAKFKITYTVSLEQVV